MKIKTKQLLLSSAILASMTFATVGQAANLTASSAGPSVVFDDTSTAGDGNEWGLFGRDDTFGLFNYINSHYVLRITPSVNTGNSFMVDSSGDINLADGTVFIDRSENRVGIGTTTPESLLHLKSTSGNANISLEDDDANWKLSTVSGGSGIMLIDVQNNRFPFYIRNNSPSNSIHITASGVGIGIREATAKLDVNGDIKATFTGANPNGTGLIELFKMSANNTNAGQFSDAGFAMENARAGFSWAFRTQENTGGFAASKQGTGAKEFEVRNTTNVATNVELHLANGARNVSGQWLNASSRSYKKNIKDLSNEEAMQTLRSLKSVKYQFKRDDSNQQMVGFIAEDVPALLATKDRKTVDPLQIVAVLTKALQSQDVTLQAEIKAKDRKIAKMELKIEQLMLMQEKMAETMEANFRPYVAKTTIINQQITASKFE